MMESLTQSKVLRLWCSHVMFVRDFLHTGGPQVGEVTRSGRAKDIRRLHAILQLRHRGVHYKNNLSRFLNEKGCFFGG